MELSSDSDDCQLYTRTAANVGLKRKNLKVKLKEFEKVINLVPHDNLQTFVNEFNSESYSDINISEDEVPLSELSKKLRRSRRKIKNKCNPAKVKKSSKTVRAASKRKKSSQSNHTTRDLGVIVFDDDTGYPSNSLPPIDFNSRSKQRSMPTPVDDNLTNISLNSILDKEFDEDECFYDNSMVTLTVEWNNGRCLTRKEFKLNKYQKFQIVFEELAKMERISTNRVLLMYNFNSVSPMDSPASLNLKFYGALTGSVSTTELNHDRLNFDSCSREMEGHNKGNITVKLQLESQQTLSCAVMTREKVDILYKKCCEEFKCEQNKIKITFDGECVTPDEHFCDLDIEDGDVFHVYMKI